MEDKFRFTLDSSEGFLRITPRGVVRHGDLESVWGAITQDGTFVHARRLWDIRYCKVDLSYDELTDLAVASKPRDLPGGRIALLASKDVTFGISRIHSVFRESENVSVMVFRDEEQAVRWLIA